MDYQRIDCQRANGWTAQFFRSVRLISSPVALAESLGKSWRPRAQNGYVCELRKGVLEKFGLLREGRLTAIIDIFSGLS